MLWWTALALAAPPDREAATFDVGDSGITDLVLSSDAELLAFHDGASAFLLDVDAWSTTSSAPCAPSGVALVEPDADTTELWVSCGDGTVHALAFDGAALTPAVDEDGEPRVFEVGAATHGLWWDAETAGVYVLAEDADATVPSLHVVDPETDAVDTREGFPGPLVYPDFVDGIVSGRTLYVAHGGDDMSVFTLGSAVARPNLNPFGGIQPVDLAPSTRESVYVVSPQAVSEYLQASTMFQIWLTGLDQASALGVSTDPDDEYALLADPTGVDVYALSGGTVSGTDPVDGFETSQELDDIVVTSGYAFGGGASGGLAVMTANPWVSDLTVTPATATEGTELTVSFEVDTPGSWTVRLGGDRTGTGEVLAAGEVDAAGPVETTFAVDDAWREGTNRVYVLHEDAEVRVGHARASVVVDSPPDRIALTDDSLGTSEEALLLTFDALTDEDLERYDVYVATAPFSPDDWPSGGPDFDGEDPIDAPIRVPAGEDDPVVVRISPLTNGETYYIAVRAVDAGGLEGPMSEVVEGTPSKTYTASELAGATGCATTGAGGGLAGLLVAGLALLARRPGAALALGLVLAAPAHAQDDDIDAVLYEDEEVDDDRGDITPVFGNVELRFGQLALEDESSPIARVYDGWGEGNYGLLMLEAGPQFWGFLEFDLGVGFMQQRGQQLDADGNRTADETSLAVVPVSVSGSLRGQLWDEQFLVPFVSLGGDYYIWREAFDVSDGTDSVTGATRGWHTAIGLNFLLDVFGRSRASLLEAQSGINDSYLVVELRQNRIADAVGDDEGGFDFTSNVLTAGLKLDF